MLRGGTESIFHLLFNCMQSADTLLICITQQKKQLILRSLYYHPKAKLVFFKTTRMCVRRLMKQWDVHFTQTNVMFKNYF